MSPRLRLRFVTRGGSQQHFTLSTTSRGSKVLATLLLGREPPPSRGDTRYHLCNVYIRPQASPLPPRDAMPAALIEQAMTGSRLPVDLFAQIQAYTPKQNPTTTRRAIIAITRALVPFFASQTSGYFNAQSAKRLLGLVDDDVAEFLAAPMAPRTFDGYVDASDEEPSESDDDEDGADCPSSADDEDDDEDEEEDDDDDDDDDDAEEDDGDRPAPKLRTSAVTPAHVAPTPSPRARPPASTPPDARSAGGLKRRPSLSGSPSAPAPTRPRTQPPAPAPTRPRTQHQAQPQAQAHTNNSAVEAIDRLERMLTGFFAEFRANNTTK